MEPALQRRVQRYGWDKASDSYEEYWQESLRPAQRLLLEMATFQSGENILDIACGTGLVGFDALALLGENGRVTGTDISEKMVEKATLLATKKGEKRISFERMDAEELSLEDNVYDAALCALGLMYMPDPCRALKEMHRVLKPGGRAVAAVWGQRTNCGWADLFEIVDQHVTSEVCPMFFNLGNPDMLKLNFEAAGFRNIRIQRINTFLKYKDENGALGAAFEAGPVALAYHKFNEETRRIVRTAYISSLAAYKKDGGFEVPGEFVVARGER